jgi:hypothetical protein
MKKQLLSFSTLIVTTISIAQTTITSTSQIGYTAPLIIVSAATATTVPISTSGAGVTWNCANLQQETGTPIVNFTVSSPTGTPYANDYPNANWYFTDPGLSSIVGHHYYSLTADSLVLWGEHTPGNSYEIYSNPEMELRLPFAYNTTVVNSYNKTNYYSNGSVSSYQTGTNTITYDSYGTLVLPNGTFNNVARIQNVRTNSLGPTTTSYQWYLAPSGEKLMEYETNGGIKVLYNNSIPSGISNDNFQNVSVSIFPNPSAGDFTFKIITKESVVGNELIISDITGKQMKSFRIQSAESKIDCADLAKGIYLYHLKNNNGIFKTGRFILN